MGDHSPGLGTRDPGFGIRDSGFGVQPRSAKPRIGLQADARESRVKSSSRRRIAVDAQVENVLVELNELGNLRERHVFALHQRNESHFESRVPDPGSRALRSV